MAGLNRRPSVPAWTALVSSSSRSSAAPSESSSSPEPQDMQDELAETPAPDGSPQAGHKRKGDGNRKTVHNHKRMRIGDRVNVLSRGGSPDDLPASAHALPVRKPAFTQPPRPRPPLFPSTHTSALAARKRAFEEHRGLAPSTSASPQTSSSNSQPQVASYQRSVARKSAAMPPPGQRRERRSYDAGASSRQQSPLATAPLRMASGIRDRSSSKGKAHNPSSSDSSVNLPSVSEIIKDLYRKRERNATQNMRRAPAIPRNRSKSENRRKNDPIDVIELTDSDGGLPARPRPSFPTNSEREIIEIDDDDHEPVISTHTEAVRSASAAAFVESRSSNIETNTGPEEDTRTMNTRRKPDPTPLSSAYLNLAASSQPNLIQSTASKPFISSPSSSRLSSRSESSGAVETLVPALDDMALASSDVSAASDSPAHDAMEVEETQTVESDCFEDWSRKDGSGTNTTADRSASHSDDEAGPGNLTTNVLPVPVVVPRPLTPKPIIENLSFNPLAAESAKKKRRWSRISTQLAFTPSAVSPASSPSSSASTPVVPSRATGSPLSPSASRRKPSAEVRGHLFGGGNGFFKYVHQLKESTEGSRLPSSSRNSPAVQESLLSASRPFSKRPSPSSASPAPVEERVPPWPISPEPVPNLDELYPTTQLAPPSVLADASTEGSLSLPPAAATQDDIFNDLPTGSTHSMAVDIEKPKKLVPIPRSLLGSLKAKAHHSIDHALVHTVANIQTGHRNQQAPLIDLALSARQPEHNVLTSTIALAKSTSEMMSGSFPLAVAEGRQSHFSSEDACVAIKSTTPDLPVAQLHQLVDAPRVPEAEHHNIGDTPIQPAVSLAISPGPHEELIEDEDSVRNMLVPSSRSSPDPADVVSTETRRRSTRSSSGQASQSGSPALGTPPDLKLRTDSWHLDSHVIGTRRTSHNHVDNDDEHGMSWRNYGELKMRQYAEVYLRASSLPHSIQDYMNTMPEFMKHTPGLQRTIFKAVIKSNTMDIEPHAPDIDIINEVDNVPCPPFEFYYTNQMWHSDNVPTPDPSKLKGCSCYPVCSPGSKTCSCLQKQRNYYTADMSGFTYDSRGRLREKYVGYPVFECNALCGCDDDCMNRVVQHGRRFKVNIEKTIDKGWGIFAAERIPARTYIGVYSGEFITDTEGEARGSVYHLGNRTYLFDVDFWHLQQGKGKNWNQNYCVDAYHAGNFTRYLNHSCDPNCQLVPVYINEPDLEKPLLAIFTIKDIFAYQELCFSYSGPPDDGKDEDGNDSDSDEQNNTVLHMSDNIFVECKCGSAKCTGKMFR